MCYIDPAPGASPGLTKRSRFSGVSNPRAERGMIGPLPLAFKPPIVPAHAGPIPDATFRPDGI